MNKEAKGALDSLRAAIAICRSVSREVEGQMMMDGTPTRSGVSEDQVAQIRHRLETAKAEFFNHRTVRGKTYPHADTESTLILANWIIERAISDEGMETATKAYKERTGITFTGKEPNEIHDVFMLFLDIIEGSMGMKRLTELAEGRGP